MHRVCKDLSARVGFRAHLVNVLRCSQNDVSCGTGACPAASPLTLLSISLYLPSYLRVLANDSSGVGTVHYRRPANPAVHGHHRNGSGGEAPYEPEVVRTCRLPSSP